MHVDIHSVWERHLAGRGVTMHHALGENSEPRLLCMGVA